jgi:hypothetical protein
MTCALAPATAACPERRAEGQYSRAWRIGDVIAYRTPELRVDADGAPDAYRVDGRGLSYTCDGVVAVENGIRYTHRSHPEIWQAKCNAGWAEARQTGDYRRLDIFGFETRNGVPVVQGPGDPFPGEAFVTTTSVKIPRQPSGTQRENVNAREIPFVVLPSGFVRRHRVMPGAIAVAFRPKTGRLAFAAYGDSGGLLNEASVRLHQDLGGNPFVTRNGVQRAKRNINDLVLVAVFPRLAPTPDADHGRWRTAIEAAGRAAFNSWGGVARLRACTE